MKRFFITYLLLVTSLLANAQFSGKGSGTAEDPYQISTPIHVDEIRNLTGIKNICLVLTGDIDMADYITENYGDAGWYPIPDFQGILNGCGYTVSGLRINRPNLGGIGFFSSVNNAKISNLTLEYNGDIISGGTTGAFAATATKSEVHRCGVYAKRISTDKDYYLGGFVGYSKESSITESCCCFSEAKSIYESYDCATGGLIGKAVQTTIVNNRVFGNVKGVYVCGGISGSGGNIENCLFEGNVYGRSVNRTGYYEGYFGGIIGDAGRCNANVIIADTIESDRKTDYTYIYIG